MASLAEVTAPQNEEGTKATILKWCKTAGESILKDEPLLELETDKVTVEIPSPASGVLVEILKQPNEEVLPGQLLARVRTDAGGGAKNRCRVRCRRRRRLARGIRNGASFGGRDDERGLREGGPRERGRRAAAR